MTDPTPTPGERRPGGSPRLDRAPGERYAARSASAPAVARVSLIRTLLTADLVAIVGAVVFFALCLLDLGPGLVAAAAGIGWITALALVWRGEASGFPDRRTRVIAAVTLAVAAIVLGFLLNWAWSRVEGGVLDPIAYLDDRWGLLPWADIAAAGIVAGLRAR